MYEEMRVKYLFVNLKYPAYVKLETGLVIAWLVAAVVCFLFARESHYLVLRSGWWLCLLGAVLESGESLFAVRQAKTRYSEQLGAGDSV